MGEEISRKREEQAQRPRGGSMLAISEEGDGVAIAGNKGEISSIYSKQDKLEAD